MINLFITLSLLVEDVVSISLRSVFFLKTPKQQGHHVCFFFLPPFLSENVVIAVLSFFGLCHYLQLPSVHQPGKQLQLGNGQHYTLPFLSGISLNANIGPSLGCKITNYNNKNNQFSHVSTLFSHTHSGPFGFCHYITIRALKWKQWHWLVCLLLQLPFSAGWVHQSKE